MPDSEESEAVCSAPEEVLDRLAEGVFGLDTDWRFTYLNRTGRAVVCDAAGESATAAALVGRSIWAVVPGAVGTMFETKYREAMRTQEEVSFDAYYEPLDAWLAVRASPSETGLSVCFRDITERRRRHDRIATRKAVLRRIYEAIADRESTFEERVDDLLRIGQQVLDTDYGTLSRVRGDEYVFEVVRSPGDLKAGDTVDLSATNCERVVATEETLVVEDVADDPELGDRAGHARWGIDCYLGTPVVVDDEVYGTFCFYDGEARTDPFSDWEVTLVDLMGRWVSAALERRLTEDRLRHQNDRLERFATLVSHDLRNPLNVAEGWLEMAREECATEALENVADSHERMRTIIDDLLTLARAGRAVDDPDDLDLGTIAADAWAQVETETATMTVDLDRHADGDRPRVQRLFENLFRNAVEHGPGAGTRAVSVAVGPLADGFYVADDGVGIPESERDDVLEFGYTTADDGTGIGLGVVGDVAAAHGWTVRVTGSDEGGARFEFENVT
jgi:GAF domain-containing protein